MTQRVEEAVVNTTHVEFDRDINEEDGDNYFLLFRNLMIVVIFISNGLTLVAIAKSKELQTKGMHS